MEWWKDGANYLGEEKHVLSVFRGSLFFFPALQQPLFKTLVSQLEKVEGDLFCFYSNKLNAKHEKHREE